MSPQPAPSRHAEGSRQSSSAIVQGWRTIAVAAAGQSLGIGLVGNFQVLVTPLTADFGASQMQMGIGMTLLIASGGVGATLMGPVADHGPLRRVMVLGVLAMLASLLALSFAQSLSQLALCAALFGAATATYGHVPANVLLVNRFRERRGTAVALAAMGLSISGMGMPPLVTWMVDHIGWRDSVSAIALGVAVILLPIFAFWVAKEPAGAGAVTGPTTSPNRDTGSHSPREILAEPNFWRLALGLGLATSATVGLGVFLIPYLEGLGVPRQSAAWAPTTLAATSFCAKPMVGFCVDRIRLRLVILVVFALFTLGWTLLGLVADFRAALLAAALLGVGAGGLLVLGPVMIGAIFGGEVVGRVTAFQVPVALPFLLAVPPALGYVRDTTGSFAPAFLALAAMVVLAALLLLSLRFHREAPQAA